MTNRDTHDMIMGKLMEMEDLNDTNHSLTMKSLESIAEIITVLNKRISDLEVKVYER